LKHNALLITRGKDGMALFERSAKTTHIPIHGTDEIADVTGAGDTVISVFTLALAAGGTFADAARLANYAGGIVVMKQRARAKSKFEVAVTHRVRSGEQGGPPQPPAPPVRMPMHANAGSAQLADRVRTL
jgi:bifunctional ADP-heptose synthase (sugar kinase/adenylyltransferase)